LVCAEDKIIFRVLDHQYLHVD